MDQTLHDTKANAGKVNNMDIKVRDRIARKWVSVKANRVYVPHLRPFKFYVHRDIQFSVFTVSEPTSGKFVDRGMTRKEAIENAKRVLAVRTAEDVRKAIDISLREIAEGHG